MKKEYYVFGALALVLLLLFAYESYWWYGHSATMGGMMQQMHGGAPTMMGFSWTWFAFLFLLVAFAFYLLKERAQPESDEATAILEKRYASGEITREQYLQILRDLKEEK